MNYKSNKNTKKKGVAQISATPTYSSSHDVYCQLSHVTLSYDLHKAAALNDISLTISQGEHICILGANGSGKSTLAGVLCGALAPDKGEVTLAGHKVFSQDTGVDPEAYRSARSHISLVFQDPEDQIITCVVEDDVAFGPENLGVSPREIGRRVKKSLHTVAMEPFAKKDPTRLSGGQQQRVAIAGALAMEGDIFIADEPCAMLDVRGKTSTMKLLKKMDALGKTTIHITHFVEQALEADRIIVLDKGSIALEGSPSEVFAQTSRLEELGLDLPFAEKLAVAINKVGKTAHHDDAVTIANDAIATDDTAAATADAATADDAATETSCNQKDKQEAIEPILFLDSISYTYPASQDIALDNVSLKVMPGEFYCIVGQTGSGKSTLLRIASALLYADQGHAYIAGLDCSLKENRSEIRRKVGFVMQKPERQLFAPTVEQDIAFGPTNLGYSKSEIQECVDRVCEALEIQDLRQSCPFELSEGQKRMVAIAGVLAMSPQLLILDEPMSGLDPQSCIQLKRILSHLAKAGTTCIMITHSMDDACELADSICVIDQAKVLLQGSPEEVFSHQDELCACGLGIPEALRWANQARQAGIEGLGNPLTLDELAQRLCQLPSANRKG